MSIDPNEQKSGSRGVPATSARHAWLSLLLVPLLLLVLLMFAVVPSSAEQLVLGWLYFPLDVLPRMTVDWPTVVLGIIALITFVLGLHTTLRWLFQHATREGSPRAWRFRASVACAMALLLLFIAGTAMVGATHQFVWLKSGRPHDRSRRPVTGMFAGVPGPRYESRKTQWRNQLHQVGLAIHNSHDAYRSLPPGGTLDEDGRLLHGWAIYLGDYMSYSSSGVDFSVPWTEPPNDGLYRCAVPDYLSPFFGEVFDEKGYGLSHVAGNVHVLPLAQNSREAFSTRDVPKEGWINGAPLNLDDIRDGASNTLLIGEVAENFKPWGHPANLRDPSVGIGRSADGFAGPPGAGGAQFLMCDGSVRFVSDKTAPHIARALGTPAGGDIVDDRAIDRASTRE